MTQLDDLLAAQKATSDALDVIGPKVDEIATEVKTVDQEVKDLIALLQTGPTDLTEAVANAKAIAQRVGGLQSSVQAVDDQLDAIPPKP